jgi:myo-inositol-1(or 4)-monophosphatase
MIDYVLKTIKSAALKFEELSKTKNDILTNESKDIKTIIDLKLQDYITSELRKTGISVLGEESHEEVNLSEGELLWIVDPLDGTLNFTRGFGFYSVSIALWRGLEPVLGVILDLSTSKIYYSTESGGSWYDNTKIVVSKTNNISDAVLVTGFPSGRLYDKTSLFKFVDKVQSYKKVRALGCASLMLAYVAQGIFDAYEEEDIYIWDVAAGLSLVKEAGGSYTITPGSDKYKYNVRATNGTI